MKLFTKALTLTLILSFGLNTHALTEITKAEAKRSQRVAKTKQRIINKIDRLIAKEEKKSKATSLATIEKKAEKRIEKYFKKTRRSLNKVMKYNTEEAKLEYIKKKSHKFSTVVDVAQGKGLNDEQAKEVLTQLEAINQNFEENKRQKIESTKQAIRDSGSYLNVLKDMKAMIENETIAKVQQKGRSIASDYYGELGFWLLIGIIAIGVSPFFYLLGSAAFSISSNFGAFLVMYILIRIVV